MKIQKFKLFESLDETIYKEIQNMIDENQFMKGKTVANNTTVFEAGNFLLLLSDDTLNHIIDSHVKETIPGSKFEKNIDLKKAIVNLVTNNEPTEMVKVTGTNQTKVTDPNEANRFKWLGVDSKVPVGIENVHKTDVNSEEFKSMNVYSYKTNFGDEFKIKVKEGEGIKTTFLSFIGVKIGKVGDKIVLAALTAFPGKEAVTIANRNDFAKQGYYFTTQNKEVIEKSTGQMSENVENFNSFHGDTNAPSKKLSFHIERKISVLDNVFRPGSEAFLSVIKEARNFKDLLNESDRELYETTDLGNFDYFEGNLVPLDLILEEIEEVNEAEYKGKDVKLSHPMRSTGPKKYKVYVKNPQTGNIMKLNFGDVKGGLTAKISDPKARKRFADRHGCSKKKDKTKAGYWACRLTRFGHLFGGKTYPGFW
jgi:hypothetical protein